MTQVPEADLLTICRGAAMELFQKALAVVNANIKDPTPIQPRSAKSPSNSTSLPIGTGPEPRL